MLPATLAKLKAFWYGVLQRACAICCWTGILLGTCDRKKLRLQLFVSLIAPVSPFFPWLTASFAFVTLT